MSISVPCVVLDDASTLWGPLTLYRDPVAVLRADSLEEVAPALKGLVAQLAAGRHAAGYLSYELGYLLEPRLSQLLWPERKLPLLWLGVFDAPQIHEADEAGGLFAGAGRAYAGPIRWEWTEAGHAARFAELRSLIAAGDLYQGNLSFRGSFAFAGDPIGLYRALRASASAGHAAYVDDGERQILSLSPELFFACRTDRSILARPMKGTAARGADPAQDARQRASLAGSPKDRAENLMIVDLLRNDLGRIAEIGSVKVRELFSVETYPTVHQLVSAVEAKMRSDIDAADIVRALFPCGSITGAPKIRAIEVLRGLETSPRGVYCGAIGAFAPDGSARFNVAIRTVTIMGGAGELGVGGGIVFDSRSHAEYEECLLKARFYEEARKPLALIETLRFSRGEGFVRRERHLARMARSAERFGLPFDRGRALVHLDGAVAQQADVSHLRVRLTLSESGAFACQAEPFDVTASPSWRFTVSPRRVDSHDALLRHKTNWREAYEEEFAKARDLGADEVLFVNERGELTEGSRSNLFLRRDGRLLTPPLDAGLLDGCLRRALLDKGNCHEARLVVEDLARAEAIYLGNSLRGLVPAEPIAPRG